jgi:hypothetical protein
MNTFQKIVSGLIGIALVTTAVLPKRQTAGVLTAGSQGLSGLFATVMGTGGASKVA